MMIPIQEICVHVYTYIDYIHVHTEDPVRSCDSHVTICSIYVHVYKMDHIVYTVVYNYIYICVHTCSVR